MKKKTVFDIIRRPIVTEKSNYLSSYLNQYVFEVDYRATKTAIREAIETIFDVKVDRVNVMIVPAKQSRNLRNRQMRTRSSAYKKAVVTLAEGERVPIFEGVVKWRSKCIHQEHPVPDTGPATLLKRLPKPSRNVR